MIMVEWLIIMEEVNMEDYFEGIEVYSLDGLYHTQCVAEHLIFNHKSS